MPGMRWRCCFAECFAMCAWCACLNTVLRCSADACLLVPIFADHVGGLHVAMRFEWCVQAFPSGHVGPPATAGKKRREGRDCETRGGGMGGAVPKRWRSVWCMLCVIHVSGRLCRRAVCLCRTHMAFARLASMRDNIRHTSFSPQHLLGGMIHV